MGLKPMPLKRTQKATRFALILAAVGMFKVSAAALFVGTFLTLFALAPSTERADARVFLGIGPLFLLGGVVSGVLAFRAWRSRRPAIRAADG